MEKNNKEAEALGLEYLTAGRKLFLDSNLKDAVVVLQKAAALFRIEKSYRNYCEAMNILGVVMAAAGNESVAMDHYLDGLEVAIRHNIKVPMIGIYNNIGSRYHQLGAYDRALDYLLRADALYADPKLPQDDRLEVWRMVMNLNIARAYRRMGKYEDAVIYMSRVGEFPGWEEMGEDSRMYRFSYMVSEAFLKWELGQKDEVIEALPELVSNAMKDGNVSDYVRDMQEFLELLEKIGNKSYWEVILQSVEQYARNRDFLYAKIIAIEGWIRYFRYYEIEDKYRDACVIHTKLMMEMKKAHDLERVDAMDLKMNLRRKEMTSKRLEKLANIDALTGLGNRNKMEEDAERLLGWASSERHYMAMGIFDLDHFKTKNDKHGHLMGDSCIKCLVGAIEKTFSTTEYVYRFGGDEFIVLLADIKKPEIEELAAKLKDKLREEQSKDERLSEIEDITVSQGYAVGIPTEGDTMNNLLDAADKALYHVKENGRDGFMVYDHNMINELGNCGDKKK